MVDTLVPNGRPPRPRAVIWTYLYLWLMVGFFSGTAVLLGPAGWLSTALQRAGWEQRSVNLALMALILVWLVATVFVSVWLVRRVFRGRSRGPRVAVPLAVTVLAGLALVEWMNPARMLARVAGGTAARVEMGSGAEFIFGPYPDRARLEELKAEGFDAVVSLQHSAVPIEVPGIREERRAAAELGLEFVHAPMLPWISDNEASLNTIRTLVREGRGRYYVHCGLGRDRATVVRRLVESMGGRQTGTRDVKTALTFADREAQAAAGEINTPAFERGPLVEVEPDVWLVPHPNRRELFGYMLAGQVRHVVSVLDPTDPEQREWIDEQRRAFAAYSVPVTFLPLADGGDSVRARAIVEAVDRLPRPVAVVAPRTPFNGYGRPRSTEGVAETLHRAFQRRPPLAPGATAARDARSVETAAR